MEIMRRRVIALILLAIIGTMPVITYAQDVNSDTGITAIEDDEAGVDQEGGEEQAGSLNDNGNETSAEIDPNEDKNGSRDEDDGADENKTGNTLNAPIQRIQLKSAAAANIDSGSNYSYTSEIVVTGFRRFHVGDMVGTCIQPGVSGKTKGTAKLTKLSNDTLIAKVAYQYGAKNNYIDGTDAQGRLLMRMTQYCMDPETTLEKVRAKNWTETAIQNMIKRVEACKTISVPDSFSIYRCDPTDGAQSFVAWDYVPTGFLTLTKASANTSISSGNAMYSLAGATFSVRDSGGNQVGTLTTDASGKTNTIELEAGTYTVTETKAPTGYALDTSSKTVKIESEKTATVSFSDKPQSSEVDVLLRKVDAETGEPVPMGAATLEGASFQVDYYDGIYTSASQAEASGNPKKSWTFVTADAEGKLHYSSSSSGGAVYQNSQGKPAIPLGTIVIREVEPPAGYNKSSEVVIKNIRSTGTAENVSYGNAYDYKEQVIRGDIEFVKQDDSTSMPMPNVAFTLTHVKTGEKHVIVTDQNGRFSSSASRFKHSNNTNKNDNALNEDGSVDEPKLDPSYGVFFSMDQAGNISSANDALCGLPYGKYILDELRTSANEGRGLLKNHPVTIDENGYLVHMGTLRDFDEPYILTEAVDGESGTHQGTASSSSLIDHVNYYNLKRGEKYIMRGNLIDKATGEPILIDGEPIIAEKEFTAKGTSGIVNIEFKFPEGALTGLTVVAFEKCILAADGTVIAVHEDPEDEDQSVYYKDKPVENETPKDGPKDEPKLEPEPQKENPEITKVSKKSSAAPATGDYNNAVLYMLLLFASVFEVIIMIVRRSQRGSRPGKR